ncbi:MAG: HEAT repeat domain-containing protein [Verrucomicrobia subdivision 3 bacterium]|nr:HEAT repeat domain-containing protein [Limisphaerales bacterium]
MNLRHSLSALLLAAVAAFPAEFKFGGQTITLPGGFEIELVAGPPLVDRPIVADFDDQGRLYVADSAGVNDKPEKQLQDRPHRIVRLEDTDGDGKFDKQTVFADKMMFPEGLLWFDGAVYCGAPPSVWKLEDTDGDGVADKREEWFKGGVLTGCANDVHGPYLGPDGWIYWTKGAFAKMNIERPGRPPIRDRAAHIFRARPDGTDLEVMMSGGMDNPVEVAFSPDGEPFFTTTFYVNPEAGRRDAIVHLIYGGAYPKVHDVLDDIPRTGDLLPPLTHLGPAVPSGLAMYQSPTFGADFHLNLFSTQFNLHKVQRHALEPFGASFRSRDIDFLVSDSADFHPTDVLEDADGTLLVLDTGGWYKLCCPTSQLAKPDVLGAIYRIRRTFITPVEDPRGLKIDWKGSAPARLTRLLDDERPAVRQRAIGELSKRTDAAIDPLAASLRSGTVERRRNALWALTRIQSPKAREVVRRAFSDSDAGVRKVAIYSAGLHRDREALSQLTQFLTSGSAHLRRCAATALGRLEAPEAVPALLAAAPGPSDRILEHSIIFALMEIANPDALRAGLTARNPFTKRAALIALDQMNLVTPDLRAEPRWKEEANSRGLTVSDVIPHLSSSDELLRQTSRWIAGHHPDWGGELSGMFRNRLLESTAAEQEELQRQLAEFGRDSAIQALLAESASSTNRQTRLVALGAMTRARLREAPKNWIRPLAKCLTSGDDQIAAQAVAAVRALSGAKGGLTNLHEQLLEVARDTRRSDEVRLDALAAMQGALPLDDELFDFLRRAVDSSRSPVQRTAAASVLGRARLSEEQLDKLIDTFPTVGPLELSRLIGAFENATDEALGLKLVAALKTSPGLKGLRADTLKPRLAKFPESVQREGEVLLRLLNVDLAQQKARLDELQSSLTGGDHRRGQLIFNGTRAACATCHAIGYLGGQLGPDLTRIGSVRTERDLLESLIYPSASFARAYEPMIVETRDGDEHSGIIKRETAETIQLITGPGAEQTVARSDVAAMRPGTLSVMPEGLEQQLTRQELADLVAFLKSLK